MFAVLLSLISSIRQRFRTRAALQAEILALRRQLLVIPCSAFGTSLAVLAFGSFLMQAGVQGAWGVIPVHLNGLTADETRGLIPRLAYQLGILIAAPTNSVEFMLRGRVG
jgi:MFS transporter, SHS family, lactate transporter